MLMLAVMTFNVGILIATTLGIGFGYLALGFSDIKLDLTNDGRAYVSEFTTTAVY